MGSVAKDTIKVTCIVDNAVQTSSQFWGEHGLSFLIETAQGHVLFDTGQTSTVLLHNLQVAGVDPAAIAAIAAWRTLGQNVSSTVNQVTNTLASG